MFSGNSVNVDCVDSNVDGKVATKFENCYYLGKDLLVP